MVGIWQEGPPRQWQGIDIADPFVLRVDPGDLDTAGMTAAVEISVGWDGQQWSPLGVRVSSDGKPLAQADRDGLTYVVTNLDALVRGHLAVALGARRWAEARSAGLTPAEAVAGERAGLTVAQSAERKRKRQNRRRPDETYLRELAQVFTGNPDAPAKAVETWADIAPATASRHIARARSEKDPATRRPYLRTPKQRTAQ